MKILFKSTIMNLSQVIVILSLIPATMMLTGCGKSERDLCIDKQTHLWDNTRGKTKEENQAYWTAVENCRKKYK